MRTEEREGRPALVDEEGVEVMRGDPLCVGSLTYFYGWLEELEPVGEAPGGLSVALLEWPDATSWKCMVAPDDDELYRGPSVYDEVEAERLDRRVPLRGVTYQ